MINKKLIAKNSLMLYIRMILVTIASLYTSRIVFEALGVEDYGIYNVVGGVVLMLGFLNTAMSSATQRFLSFELGKKDYIQLSKVFSSSVTIHIIIALVLICIAETLGLWFLNNRLEIPDDRVIIANWIYQFSILTFVVGILSVPYNAIIISYERMNVFAYFSLIEVALKFILVYVLLYVSVDRLRLYAILMFAVSLIIRIFYQVYCSIKIPASKYHFVWDKQVMKDLISYAGWSLFGGIAYIAKSQGLNIVLNIFFGVLVNAAYAISQQISTAVLSMINNFTMALNPAIVKSYASNDLDSTYKMVFVGMRYSFFLTSCIIFPLIINTESIILFWLGSVPEYSVKFTQYSMMILLLESIIHPIAAYIQATGKVKLYQSIIGTLLFLILPISYFALKIIENPNVVFYAAILITIISVIGRFVIMGRSLKYNNVDLFFLLRIISILCLTNLGLYYCVNNKGVGLFAIFINSAISISLTIILFILVGMKTSEKNLLKNKYKYMYENLIKNSVFLVPLRYCKKIIKKALVPIKYRKERTELNDEIKNYRTSTSEIIFLLATPMHGNLGDHAIVYAQKAILSDLSLINRVIEIDNDFYLDNKKFIKRYINTNDIIIIDGGGNLGTLWPWEDDKITDIINTYCNNKIIVFPQTCYYDSTQESLKRLVKNNTVYSKAKGLTIALRDQKSFEFCKNNFDNNIDFKLIPDVVLYLNNVNKDINRDGVLLCLRQDLEKIFSDSDAEILKDELKYKGILFKETTTVVPYNIDSKSRNYELEKKWREFSSSKLVITDRLHGMIFAIITGTPCLALDNISKKVSGVYNIINKIENVRICSDIDDLINSIDSYYAYNRVNHAVRDNRDDYIDLINKLNK